MTISVAMCTYNGARYIQEQLKSILSQTRKVDEIVICDDGSTDDTLKIINNTIKSLSTAVRVIRNKENLGYFQNFLQAISLCTGNLIFLSDQDDVWRKDKVEDITEWFDVHSDKDVVFTDAKLIDAQSQEFTEDTLWDRVGFDKRMRKYLDKGYGQEIWTINNRATGATMALRSSFVKNTDWMSYNLPVHDYIISLMAVINSRCGYIEEPLTSYRIHAGQTIGASGYEPCFYSPLRAYTIELDHMQNLPQSAIKRLEFMRKREGRYTKRFGGLRTIVHVGGYVVTYGAWWYRFWCYDIYMCIVNDVYRLKAALVSTFRRLKKIARKC